jgi:hypothetical protein
LTILNGILAKRKDLSDVIYSRTFREQREAFYAYEIMEEKFRALTSTAAPTTSTPDAGNKPPQATSMDEDRGARGASDEDPFADEERARQKSGLSPPTGKMTLIAPREHFQKWAKHFKGLELEQVRFKLTVKATQDDLELKVLISNFRMALVAKFVNFAYFVDKYNNAGFPFLPNDLLLATTGIGFDSTRSMRPLQLLACQAWATYRSMTNTATPRELWMKVDKRELVKEKILGRLKDPKRNETSAEQLFHRCWPDYKTYNKELFGKEKDTKALQGKKAKPKPRVKKSKRGSRKQR